MGGSFREALSDPKRFVITLELVPGPESRGRSVDTVKAIAADALKDGRVSAVSITDNPGGGAALSPDVLGREILDMGMDVIVHCTCRDLNRAGLESRALQLARMGMRNILALTGDYSSRGFAGQGLPVFDLEAVSLICLLNALNKRNNGQTDGEQFFIGCAVSPFKSVEAECFAQYAKLRLKRRVGARFVITQLGYDAGKFQELLQVQRDWGIEAPTLGTVYVLTPGAARAMHDGKVPGAVVPDELLKRVTEESGDKAAARQAAIERAARLAAVLKGLGYRGIHLSGVHRSFGTAAQVLDRFEALEDQWRDFLPEFDFPQPGGYYLYGRAGDGTPLSSEALTPRGTGSAIAERWHYRAIHMAHELFFNFDSPLTPLFAKSAAFFDKSRLRRFLVRAVEDPAKWALFRCKRCGDCAIQHLAFLCPESKCPKHMRNGACGGSTNGKCEVYPDRPCIYVRVYNRLRAAGMPDALCAECIPPRMWSLNDTSSWLNFHRRRDHQSLPCEIAQLFDLKPCPAEMSGTNGDCVQSRRAH